MAHESPITKTTQTVTTTATSGTFPMGTARRAHFLLNVSAPSGTTPTLDVTVEWSHDGTTFAVADPTDSFAQITAAKVVAKSFDVKAPMARLRYTTGGTSPSFPVVAGLFTTS